MANTGVPAFETTIEKTNRWLTDLEQVKREAPALKDAEIEPVVTAVFGLLAGHVSRGEADQIRALLPPELRELWPRPGL